MFPEPPPHLFALPPGADFAQEIVAGLDARMAGKPPEALARATLLVNTRRMARRLREVYDAGPPRLLPRIRLITDLAHDAAEPGPPASPLRRRLEVAELVRMLLKAEPDLAPEAALYDLADSLIALVDEMQGEGVPPERLAELDVTDLSGHWERSRKFLGIVAPYFAADAADPEARQRRAVIALTAAWAARPPDDPVIVAGSTASRGTTALLVDTVARLPTGAVILPGFDRDLPQDVWDGMDDALAAEDHPQYRFRAILDRLGLAAADVRPWTDAAAPDPARNRLISLALRPAPVTDQWRARGPALGDLPQATAGLTLLEAPSPRAEAEAIALRLRAAAEDGITAALVSPDRMLTRQVAAALDRWEIVADDSAGTPLALSPPGRFLRQVAQMMAAPVTGPLLLALLKHPLCHSDGSDRGPHLRRTRELELELRRKGPPFPAGQTILAFAEKRAAGDPGRMVWAEWLADCLDGMAQPGDRPLPDRVAAHLALAERLAQGPGQADAGGLWDAAAGRKAREVTGALARHADAGGPLSAADYARLVDAVIGAEEVRDRDRGHPRIRIWGTLEARVQGADLMILAGLNEGAWPETPAADPWLNRRMRAEAGLLLPERRIGLSAHDFQQAAAGREVWLTRAIRSDEAETVPSRWLNRLTNLLDGLSDQRGPEALAAMRARGARWVEGARRLSEPPSETDPARRPSPRPPVEDRPKQLPVTAVERLIRDPYSIYAERILGLRALDPLTPEPDAPLRGTLIHRILERFLKDTPDPARPDARTHLLKVADDVLSEGCPWPTIRQLWLARMARVADWFLETEVARQARGRPAEYEVTGAARLPGLDFTLSAKADRIDLAPDGAALVYDYKTGKPPTVKQQGLFDKQLLLEAALVEQGAFPGIGAARVTGAAYIGLGSSPEEVTAPLDAHPPAQVWAELGTLMTAWADRETGYTSRRMSERMRFAGDHDHLARFGEWDDSDAPEPEDVP